jgi:predicted component of type VI protein secretion system
MPDSDRSFRRLEGGWRLCGSDGAPKPMRLIIGDTEIARAYLGLVVGRHPALCDRTIDDITVSHRHCRFSVRDGQLFVEDLNSLNGTLVDGADIPPFEPTPVREGQTLTLGRLSVTISRFDGARDR